MITFPTRATWQVDPPFDAATVLHGRAPDQATRRQPGRIWVDVDGADDCLHFYGADHPSRAVPLIYLEGDTTHRMGDGWALFDGYTRQRPAGIQAWAEQIAVAAGRPFVFLGRPGVYGSSGNHQHRRRPREVALVDSAISALMQAQDWSQVDLAGMSGGGHLVACLMAKRSDIGCAVIASGNVSVRQRNSEQMRVVDVTGFADFVDPVVLVHDVARHPPRRVIVLTDPKDQVVSAACQQAYVDALRKSGVPVDHRLMSALDDAHHNLRDAVLLAACSRN